MERECSTQVLRERKGRHRNEKLGGLEEARGETQCRERPTGWSRHRLTGGAERGHVERHSKVGTHRCGCRGGEETRWACATLRLKAGLCWQ